MSFGGLLGDSLASPAPSMADRQSEQIRSLLATLQSTTKEAARQRQVAGETARALDSARRQAADASAKAEFLEAELRSAARTFEDEVGALQERVESLSAELGAERQRTLTAEVRLAESNVAASHVMDDMEILRLQREHAAATKDVAMASARISEAHAETAEARAALSATRREVQALQTKLAQQGRVEERVRALELEKEQALSSVSRVKESAARMQQEFGGQLNELQRALTSTAARLSATRSDKERLQQELEEARAEVDTARARASKGASPAQRSPPGVRFALPDLPPSPKVGLAGAPHPSHRQEEEQSDETEGGPEGTDPNVLALTMYAQKLEEEVGAEKKRTAAALLGLVLLRAVNRSMRRSWAGLAEGGQGEAHPRGGRGRLGSPTLRSVVSPSTSHLERLASTPLSSLRYGGGAQEAAGRAASEGSGAATGASAAAELDRMLQEVASGASHALTLCTRSGQSEDLRSTLQSLVMAAQRSKSRLAGLRPLLSATRDTDLASSALTSSSVGIAYDPQGRLRLALAAAHERADKAEAEAFLSREESSELRLRATALHGAVKSLLGVLGLAPVLTAGGVAAHLPVPSPGGHYPTSLSSPSSPGNTYADDAEDGIGMDAGLLGAAFGTSSLPVSPEKRSGGLPPSRTAHSPGSSGGRAAFGPTPEAVSHAVASLTVLRVQLQSLCGLLDGSGQDALEDAVTAVLANGEPHPQTLLSAARASPASLQSVVRRLESAVKSAVHWQEAGLGQAAPSLAAHDTLMARLADAARWDGTRLMEAEVLSETVRGVREEVDARARAAVRTIADLHAQVDAGARVVRTHEAELARTKDALAGVTADADALRQELEPARADVESSRQASARAKSELDALRTMMREALGDARKQFTADIEALTRQRDEAEAKAHDTAQELGRVKSDAAAELTRLRAETSEWERTLTGEAQRQLTAAAADTDARLRDAAAAHADALDRCLQQHAAEVAAVASIAASDQAALAAAHEKELSTIMSGSEGRVAALSADLAALRAALLDKEVALEDKEAQIVALNADLEQLHGRTEQVTAVLGSVTAELESQMLAATLAIGEAEAARAAGADAEHLRAGLSAAKAIIVALKAEVQALKDQIEVIKEEAADEVDAARQEVEFVKQATDEHAKSYVARMLSANGVKR